MSYYLWSLQLELEVLKFIVICLASETGGGGETVPLLPSFL
jgi:hypothetical protein